MLKMSILFRRNIATNQITHKKSNKSTNTNQTTKFNTNNQAYRFSNSSPNIITNFITI